MKSENFSDVKEIKLIIVFSKIIYYINTIEIFFIDIKYIFCIRRYRNSKKPSILLSL